MTANQQIKDKKKVKNTDHPHIVKIEGIRGGRPVIKGTAITVDLIAFFFKAGESVDEILIYYPHLKAFQVYDAISYYLDHQKEIETFLEQQRIDNVLKGFDMEMDELGVIKRKSS